MTSSDETPITDQPELATSRCTLRPFAPVDLLALIETPERFAATFGAAAADGLREFFTSGEVSTEWLQRLRSGGGPDAWTWGYGVIEKSTGRVIGSVGFKGAPADDGSVEIGYGIVPVCQRRGFAAEAARALVGFALSHPAVTVVCAHTLPDGVASMRVLETCGFSRVGDVIDPHDGPVVRWELRREDSQSTAAIPRHTRDRPRP